MKETSILASGLLLPMLLAGQAFLGIESTVADFSLANGLRFVLMERHDSPAVSFHVLVGAGSCNDPEGKSGLAFLVARSLTKGTQTLGSVDWEDEKEAQGRVEELYGLIDAERSKGAGADETRILSLGAQAKSAIDRANALSRAGDFLRALQENGLTNFSTETGADASEFAVSLPSNRVEFWFLLQSEEFLRPAFREFYRDRNAIAQQGPSADPQVLIEKTLLAKAFSAHPYGRPASGRPEESSDVRRNSARAFFDTYYVPANMVIAIAGDLALPDAKRLAERYFGRLPAKPLPPPVEIVEPAQSSPIDSTVTAAGSLVAVGFRRPAARHPDAPALQLLESILNGRRGLLQRELAEGKQITSGAQAFAVYPGGRYPSLFGFLLAPAAGKTTDEVKDGLDAVLKGLSSQAVDAETLQRARNQLRVAALRRLLSNRGAAAYLAGAQFIYGDWRKGLEALDELDKVGPADIQRVSLQYFTPQGRTSVVTVPPPARVRVPNERTPR